MMKVFISLTMQLLTGLLTTYLNAVNLQKIHEGLLKGYAIHRFHKHLNGFENIVAHGIRHLWDGLVYR